MGHTDESGEPAATRPVGSAARPERDHDTQLQRRLEVLKHQRDVLLEGLLGRPERAYLDPFTDEVDHQSLFDALPLPDLVIDCRNDSTFDLPRVFNITCKRRDAFNFLLRLFENRDNPDRLYRALVHVGFKAVNLKHEREEVFLLLRLDTEHDALRVRDEPLRAALNPLFRDRRVTLEGELLGRFVDVFRTSERLRNRVLPMEWQVDRSRQTLTLSPPGSCDRDEVIGSFQLFLFSRPRKSAKDRLQEVLVALFRGETARVARVLEADFMETLKSWQLLLRLCRGRRRRRDQASGDLLMEVTQEADDPSASETRG